MKLLLLSIMAVSPAMAQPGNPPPPPPPSMEPFKVYFDWNSAVPPADAEAILGQAQYMLQESPSLVLLLSGHADRSGDEAYNFDLSRRRAEALMARLKAMGVPAELMRIEAFGESRPEVDTPDGERNPYNRRVEISGMPR